jgi:hypothetical protein
MQFTKERKDVCVKKPKGFRLPVNQQNKPQSNQKQK